MCNRALDPAFIVGPLNRRHAWLNVDRPADIRTMPLLRRLSLYLLALALLPGAAPQAWMASAMAHEAAAPSALVVDADCHAVAAAGPVTAHHDAMQGGHDAATGALAGCCGDAGDTEDCGGTCPCPGALAALPLAAANGTILAHHRHWRGAGLHARDRVAEGPPKRPPIG